MIAAAAAAAQLLQQLSPRLRAALLQASNDAIQAVDVSAEDAAADQLLLQLCLFLQFASVCFVFLLLRRQLPLLRRYNPI